MTVKNRRFLLLGASGMLGRAWAQLLRSSGHDFVEVSRPTFDLLDLGSIERVVTPGFTAVINCAAWTDVDGAETSEAQALACNGTAVGRLAERCASLGAFLVHYSTDYVFDGTASHPWPIDAPRAPINAYGRSKERGEELFEQAGVSGLLIRTSWLFAPWGKNFVATMVRMGQERDAIRVVNDQRGRPSDVRVVAEYSMRLLERGASGTFHVTNSGECTWFEFARAIMELTGSACTVAPCTTAEFPRPAPRPGYSVLDLAETVRWVGDLPHWRVSLADVLARTD